jgi:hypothetical protein
MRHITFCLALLWPGLVSAAEPHPTDPLVDGRPCEPRSLFFRRDAWLRANPGPPVTDDAAIVAHARAQDAFGIEEVRRCPDRLLAWLPRLAAAHEWPWVPPASLDEVVGGVLRTAESDDDRTAVPFSPYQWVAAVLLAYDVHVEDVPALLAKAARESLPGDELPIDAPDSVREIRNAVRDRVEWERAWLAARAANRLGQPFARPEPPSHAHERERPEREARIAWLEAETHAAAGRRAEACASYAQAAHRLDWDPFFRAARRRLCETPR